MNLGNMLFATTQYSSQWSFGFEGVRYPPPSPWPPYWYQHQHPQAQPCRRGPFQILPLPADSDVSDPEEDLPRQVSRRKGKGGLTRRIGPASPQTTYSPTSATNTSLLASPQSLLRDISLRSASSGESGKLSRRPSYWRADYVPPSSPWIKKRFLELRSLVKDDVVAYASSNFHRSLRLNPLLGCPSPPPPSFYFDLRFNPLTAHNVHLPTSNGPITELHHLQLAITPSVHQLYLWHPHLPWTITIRSSNPNGILVSDILRQMYEQLKTPIGGSDWYNSEMTAEDRERIERAYKARCGGDIEALIGGIRRMDWLGSDFGFLGLSKSWNGMWEVKTVDVVAFNK